MKSFGRRGYAATTLRGIAREASVTAPMVSYYFKTKERLFLTIAEIVMSSLAEDVGRAVDRELPFHESIEAIVRAHVDLVEQTPAALEFILSLLYGPQEGQPVADIEAMYAETRRMMVKAFERGIESGEFRPRPGFGVYFLVEQLGSLIHDDAIRRFRADRCIRRNPQRREEVEHHCRETSIEIALDHFFFGAGDVPALAGRRSTGLRDHHA
jgi:AcrR family transcriptional regulator